MTTPAIVGLAIAVAAAFLAGLLVGRLLEVRRFVRVLGQVQSRYRGRLVRLDAQMRDAAGGRT